jgi:multimeric flavodoxin WrbA
MRLKIVGIISSPSRSGNTAVLVREALQAAAECGAEVEEIFLPALKLQYCAGCYHCMSEGGCPQPDGFEEIRRKLYACDGIVIGSPTYVQKPNAMMTNFINRLGLYTPYTSSLAGKYVVGISTAEGYGASKVAKDLTGIVSGMFGFGYVTGTLGVVRGSKRIEDMPEKLQRARELGCKLVSDIERRRRYPFQLLLPRLGTALIARRFILRSILDNREGRMKAVYENLVARGVIQRVDAARDLSEQVASG